MHPYTLEKINYEHSGTNLTIHDLIPDKPLDLNVYGAIEAIRNEAAKARARTNLERYQKEAVPIHTAFVIAARRCENGEMTREALHQEFLKAYNALNDMRYYED